MLKNESLPQISDHDGKATILWNAFKERMGISDKPFMHFNLQEFFGGIILLEEDKDDLELSLLIKKLMILLRIFLMRNL
jgi:hypothetical protein